jgi:hypothetical protein
VIAEGGEDGKSLETDRAKLLLDREALRIEAAQVMTSRGARRRITAIVARGEPGKRVREDDRRIGRKRKCALQFELCAIPLVACGDQLSADRRQLRTRAVTSSAMPTRR